MAWSGRIRHPRRNGVELKNSSSSPQAWNGKNSSSSHKAWNGQNSSSSPQAWIHGASRCFVTVTVQE